MSSMSEQLRADGPTFSQDESLPPMPLPKLEATLRKYLESTKPFVTETEYAHTRDLVNEFGSGIGKRLHAYVETKSEREKNWLENWWLDSYLEMRFPVAPYINTSGFTPWLVEHELNALKQNVSLDPQLAMAATQLFFLVEFFEQLRNETIPIQTSRNKVLSMNQFRNFYNTCRIPQEPKDALHVHFKTKKEGDCPTHVLVIYKNRFFTFNVLHDDGEPLNVAEIYMQLKWIVDTYGKLLAGVGIGALTAANRGDWAKTRQYLLDLDPENSRYFDSIEQSMITIALDDVTTHSFDELGLLGLCQNPRNRFYDKSYQLIFTKNGYGVSNSEHSPFDGMVSMSITHHCSAQKAKLKFDITKIDSLPIRSDVTKPVELCFKYDTRIEQEVQKAVDFFENNSSQLEYKFAPVNVCSKKEMKSYKVNPDTLIQMCMQLAYYQLHNKCAPTYETGMTRAYYHGRTETVRSCSSEVAHWCKEVCRRGSSKLNNTELLNLLRKACASHETLMNEARENAGCDRHLLGLSYAARELNLETPSIYTDPAWTKSGGSGNFIISSSCLGVIDVAAVCAPMCTDGYCIIYSLTESGANFGMMSFRNSTETDLTQMAASLESAMIQIKSLFEQNSKL